MAPVLLILLLLSTSAEASSTNLRTTAGVYFLSGNKTDSCYDEPYISDRGECVERWLALYYRNDFPVSCPNIASRIAELKCKGCPWDKINASAITPANVTNKIHSELFHRTARSCSVSEYLKLVSSTSNEHYLNSLGLVIPLFSVMFLAKTDANGSPSTPQIFGSRLKEPLYFVFLWLLFFVGYGISSAGHELYDACHDSLSFLSLLIGDWINLAMMLWTSLWRCLYLEARDRPQEVISWASYRRSELYRASSLWKRRLIDFVCWAGLPLLIVSPAYCTPKRSESSLSFCQMGSYQSIPFGLIQYSKIVTGIIAVGVYSIGPPSDLVLFYIRYFSLVIIMLANVSFLYVMQLPVYDYQGFSKLIPHVDDAEIAGPNPALLIAHTFAITLFGIFEPLRLGWPKRRNFKCDTEDANC